VATVCIPFCFRDSAIASKYIRQVWLRTCYQSFYILVESLDLGLHICRLLFDDSLIRLEVAVNLLHSIGEVSLHGGAEGIFKKLTLQKPLYAGP
jgi:hypothetical protein